MAHIAPPSITPLPPAPSIDDPDNFDTEADNFVAAQQPFANEISAVAVNVYNNAVDAFNNATAADTSRANAQAAASAATVTANAVPWVSGTTYAQNASVISQINFKTYRRKTASGSGTTDPAQDPINYVLLSVGPFDKIKVSQRLATGTGGGTSTGGSYNVRQFNTTDVNTTLSALLIGNAVTLEAGTYEVSARAPALAAGAHQISLYNSTDGVTVLVGSNARTDPTNASMMTDSTLSGRFTIAVAKSFTLRHWISSGSSGGLGSAVSATGNQETYAELTFTKVG